VIIAAAFNELSIGKILKKGINVGGTKDYLNLICLSTKDYNKVIRKLTFPSTKLPL